MSINPALNNPATVADQDESNPFRMLLPAEDAAKLKIDAQHMTDPTRGMAFIKDFSKSVSAAGPRNLNTAYLQAMFDTNGADAVANQNFAREMAQFMKDVSTLPIILKNPAVASVLSTLAKTAENYAAEFFALDAKGNLAPVTPPAVLSQYDASAPPADTSTSDVKKPEGDVQAPGKADPAKTAPVEQTPAQKKHTSGHHATAHHAHAHHTGPETGIDEKAETAALNDASFADHSAIANVYAHLGAHTPAREAMSAELAEIGRHEVGRRVGARRLDQMAEVADATAASPSSNAQTQAGAQPRSTDLQEVYVGEKPAHPVVNEVPNPDKDRLSSSRDGYSGNRGSLRSFGSPNPTGPQDTAYASNMAGPTPTDANAGLAGASGVVGNNSGGLQGSTNPKVYRPATP